MRTSVHSLGITYMDDELIEPYLRLLSVLVAEKLKYFFEILLIRTFINIK